uniref:Uncharacterized protein n=1 Tax=Rhizophora mucronata TaxID=61149 RepID=A0A2P2N9P3_RHIMU
MPFSYFLDTILVCGGN